MLQLLLMRLAVLAMAVLASNGGFLPCGLPFAATPQRIDTFKAFANGSYTGPATGTADLFSQAGAGGPRPWPRENTKDKKVVIQYCFERKHDRDAIEHDFRTRGTAIWIQWLGGKASKQLAHAIEFCETVDDDGEPMYCHEDGAGEHDCMS